MDVKLNTLALGSVLPSRRLFHGERAVYLELYLTRESVFLTVALEADIAAFFKLLLETIRFFRLEESYA